MFRIRVSTLRATFILLPTTLTFVLAWPAAARTVRYDPQVVYYTYCHSHPPASRIASGDTVITKTRDASNDAFKPTDQDPLAQSRPVARQSPDGSLLRRGRGTR
jgi:amidase